MRTALVIFAALLMGAPAVTAQTTTAAAGKTTAHRTATRHGKVDINSATDKELERLPGVDAGLAQKIIEGRPYSTVSDLTHAGLTADQIKRITPRILVGSPAHPPRK